MGGLLRPHFYPDCLKPSAAAGTSSSNRTHLPLSSTMYFTTHQVTTYPSHRRPYTDLHRFTIHKTHCQQNPIPRWATNIPISTLTNSACLTSIIAHHRHHTTAPNRRAPLALFANLPSCTPRSVLVYMPLSFLITLTPFDRSAPALHPRAPSYVPITLARQPHHPTLLVVVCLC